MDIYEIIKNSLKQLDYNPEVINGDNPLVGGGKYERFVFVGMGGSALAPDVLKIIKPEIDLIIHRDYGLPSLPDQILAKCLIVLNSYSGNTEEVLDAFNVALKKKLPMAVITVGGRLLELAKENGVPFIQMPDLGLQPRLAVGLNLRAVFKITGQDKEIEMLSQLKFDGESRGKEVAEKIKGFIPIIYSSRKNGSLAYLWKIKINEFVKRPSFSNVFPEINHNEMAGFYGDKISNLLNNNFGFIFLKDTEDGPRVLKRMETMEKILKDRNFPVEVVEISNSNNLQKVFSVLNLSDWMAYYLAKESGTDPADISMIEEFKKLI